MPDLRRRLSAATPCEIRWDNLTRQLYATDASIYQVEPQAVALPKSVAETAQVMAALSAEGIAITPRGAGTGLAGGAIGRGVVLDLARHNKQITDLNVDARTCRAGAGVVLDQLNAHLAPHGLMFAPDVATSSRATIGGMINNNSSGSRTPRYGTTIDHVRSVEMALTDGRVVTLGRGMPGLHAEAEAIAEWINAQDGLIRERFHPGIIKRWPGYAIDKFLRTGGNFATLAGGSEGTLGALWSAELQLTPLPKRKGLGLIFFETVIDAMEATVDLFDLQPDAIEHIDDVLFDETRGQLLFQPARDFLELDDKPCKSILIVEFTDDIEDRLDALMRKPVGIRKKLCNDAVSQGYVLELRKSGLSLLTSRKGDAKPTAFVEDAAVPPAVLPEYVRGLQSLFDRVGVEASYYGHAASGLLHVRPILDLHDENDLHRFRQIAQGVSDLTLHFKGSLSAEHGVGMARTEFMADHIGTELLDLMRQIKSVFDPKSIMNPGKIFPDGDVRIDKYLRQGAGSRIADSALPFEVRLGYVNKDESFVAHLEQCNGNGGCKKYPPTMCPTFLVTGEEIQSTRGRANTIRALIEGRAGGDDPLGSEDMMQALRYCLSCKACKRECPSNVDMALMKAELLHARHRKHGVPLSRRMVSRPDLLGAVASKAPGLANAALRSPMLRRVMEKTSGITALRELPPYARQIFCLRHECPGGERGTVTLWDDCFCRYNEPNIGHAAVRVLEAAGYRVRLPEGRACCGRPAFSNGLLDVAADMGRQNMQVLKDGQGPIIFLEPSCYSMFAQDYLELGLEGAADMKRRAVLFEDFMLNQLDALEPHLKAPAQPVRVGVHVHCHAKALTNQANSAALAKAMPNHEVTLLASGCCGMAGAYGMMAETYDLSLKVFEPLEKLLNGLPPEAMIVASGTSCRHQVAGLTQRIPVHMAELVAGCLRY